MIRIATDHPVAVDSPDHLQPFGCARDSSTWPAFNAKVRGLWPSLRLLDLGCAGGGLVASLIAEGCQAIGVEGSDYPRRSSLGEWTRIPGSLFCADIGHEFQLHDAHGRLEFDVVTAWEVLEHLPADRIEAALANARRHLAPDGRFMASISPRPFPPWHQTVRSDRWWLDELDRMGWAMDWEMREVIHPDWVRGPRTDPGSLVGVWRPR